MVNGHILEQREQSDACISYAESRQNRTQSMFNGQLPTVNRSSSFGVKESLLCLVVLSPITRRKASFPPIGMLPVSRGRYCDRSWERLPLAIAGIIIPDDDAKLQHGKIVTVPIGTLWYPFVAFGQLLITLCMNH
ncbi:MAG: hypothetical protein J6U14_04130 [Bacteroidaceae bacterium]|nr:hypothetical protein [Bacteroidaceae bacterium]